MDELNLTDKEWEKIADEVEAGFVVYLHKETKEIVSIIDFDRFFDADESGWKDLIRKVKNDYKSYIKFTAMESRDAFIVMEDFIETVNDKKLQDSLWNALDKRGPFRNFQNVLDYHPNYKEDWFAFKKEKTIEYFKEQLEFANK